MAWQSVDLTPLGVSVSDIDNFYLGDYRISGTSSLNYTHLDMYMIPYSFWGNNSRFLLGDAQCGIYYNASNSRVIYYLNGSALPIYDDLNLSWGPSATQWRNRLLIAGINEETQKGTIYFLKRYDGFTPIENYQPPYTNTYLCATAENNITALT